MTQVQVRMPEKEVDEIDKMVEQGKFKSRSDAIRTIVKIYEHNRKVRNFYNMLKKRSKESEEKPEMMVPVEEI